MKRQIGLALILIALASAATAATLNVPSQYPTIHAAVQAAQTGDIVQVAPGIYSDVTHPVMTPTDTTYCAVIMRSGVTVRGSGTGVTTLFADSLGRGFHCEGVTNSTIRDMTIRKAFAEVYGAAIFCTEGTSITIFNCEITNNHDGGIICLNGSSPTIQSCTFTNNGSKGGGAIAAEVDCSPVITGCVMTGNYAPTGGGIFVRRNSAPTITNCVISGNYVSAANGGGGGVTILNARPTFTNCQITNNTADGFGGGIAVLDSGVLTMNSCLIQGNRTLAANAPGGGIYVDFGGNILLDDCTITRNRTSGANSDGGGVSLSFANEATFMQCTIAANSSNGQAGMAGGMSCLFSSPVITKSIIAFNSPGKGLSCLDESIPVVSCTDIYGNEGGDALCGQNAGNNFSLDPLFCNLASDNYRLQMTSPCFPGLHPNGPRACDNVRIGAQDPGCNPAAVDDLGPADRSSLSGNPNPFAEKTTIRFELARAGAASLSIFDVSGRLVRSLAAGRNAAGPHAIDWDGADEEGRLLPAGVYFCRLMADGSSTARPIVISR